MRRRREKEGHSAGTARQLESPAISRVLVHFEEREMARWGLAETEKEKEKEKVSKQTKTVVTREFEGGQAGGFWILIFQFVSQKFKVPQN